MSSTHKATYLRTKIQHNFAVSTHQHHTIVNFTKRNLTVDVLMSWRVMPRCTYSTCVVLFSRVDKCAGDRADVLGHFGQQKTLNFWIHFQQKNCWKRPGIRLKYGLSPLRTFVSQIRPFSNFFGKLRPVHDASS